MKILLQIYPYFLYITLIISLIHYVISKKTYSSFVLLYFESVFFIDIFVDIVNEYYSKTFIVFQYGILLIFPITLLIILSQINSKKYIQFILYIILIFIVLSILINIKSGPNVFPSITFTIGSVLVILTSFFYFYDIFIFELEENLINNGMFWIISSLFLYHSGVLFLNFNFFKNNFRRNIYII